MSDIDQEKDFHPAKAGDDPIWLGGMKYVRAHRIEELEAAFANISREYDKRGDRIAELEAENKLLRDAVYIDDLTVTMQANDRLKAVAGTERALGFLDADMPTEARTALRTTLAELKGGKDE